MTEGKSEPVTKNWARSWKENREKDSHKKKNPFASGADTGQTVVGASGGGPSGKRLSAARQQQDQSARKGGGGRGRGNRQVRDKGGPGTRQKQG